MASCEIWFYQIDRSPQDRTLVQLLEKTLARGWRAVVRAGSPDEARRLDEMLWTYREGSFLPHGLADEPLADRQPVVITANDETPNGAQAMIVLDGAEPGDLTGLERCILLFDGRVEEALSAARARWKAFTAGGATCSFWREDPEKGWERQG